MNFIFVRFFKIMWVEREINHFYLAKSPVEQNLKKKSEKRVH